MVNINIEPIQKDNIMIRSTDKRYELIVEPCLVHNDVFRCIVLRDNMIVEVSRQHLHSFFAVMSSDSIPLYLTIGVHGRTIRFDFEEFSHELQAAYDAFF